MLAGAVGAVCAAVYLLTQNITAVRCVFLFSLFVLLCVIFFVALIRRKLVRFSDAFCGQMDDMLSGDIYVYRSIRIRDIWSILVEAIRTFTPILFILAASTAFSRVLTLMQVPQTVSEFILNNFHSPVAILLIINVFLLIVGMVMDTTPAILILTPILLPIIQAIGMDPIQFGVIMVVNLAIGFVTPPIGVNLFVASSLTEVPVMQIAKKAMPMIGFFLVFRRYMNDSPISYLLQYRIAQAKQPHGKHLLLLQVRQRQTPRQGALRPESHPQGAAGTVRGGHCH